MAGITPSGKGGSPIAEVDRYSGDDEEYQTLVSRTISTGKMGTLKEVSMISDTYAKTEWRLEIAGEEQFTDKIIQAPLSLPFPENKLSAGQTIVLQCRSTDGTHITCDGSLTLSEK